MSLKGFQAVFQHGAEVVNQVITQVAVIGRQPGGLFKIVFFKLFYGFPLPVNVFGVDQRYPGGKGRRI
ncbi:hypothetical protein FQZ97_1173740 [compost metagenome]